MASQRLTIMRKLILILVVVLLAPAKILAQDSAPENNKPIKIYRIKSPIILNGLSNEADSIQATSFTASYFCSIIIKRKTMTTFQKINTIVVAFFLLIPRLGKSTDPFKTMFTVQVANSKLPFPTLTFIERQASEIITGALLFSLLFFWRKFSPTMADKLFNLGTLIVSPIMVVAIYVHLNLMFLPRFYRLKANHPF